jgi:NADH-quinone oxidoreductase subunit G
VIVSGVSCGSAEMIQSAANIAWAFCAQGKDAKLCFCVPECNSMGLSLMDPGDLRSAFQSAADTVIILENDLYGRADAATVDAFLNNARHVIVMDHLETASSVKADMVFPVATFAESTGTLVNNEGRAQRFYSVFPPAQPVRDSWRWLKEIMAAAGMAESGSFDSIAGIAEILSARLPVFSLLKELNSQGATPFNVKVPRQSHRYSGRTAMTAHLDVSEPRPAQDSDSPLAYSMEGYDGRPPSGLVCRYWSPGWNSIQALNKFQQEAGGPLSGGDPGVCLIKPSCENAISFYDTMPPDMHIDKDEKPRSGQ